MNGRSTLLTCGFGLVAFAMATPAPAAADAAPRQGASPYSQQLPVGIGDARWTGGFWAERFDLCHRVIIPEMRKALEDERNGAQLCNFRIGAGLEQGKHHGTNWSDGDCYKWLEAQAWLYAVTRDPALDQQMDRWIDLIAKTQADDGYIGTQTQLNPEKQRWGQRSYHELYNHGHLLTAAVVHHQATGKDSFLAVARKLADYLYQTFHPRPKELAHFGWNPSNIMGLVDLYRVTGERRYLELAGIFVDMRGTVKWPHSMWGLTPRVVDPHPGDQNQNRVPLRKESIAVGHAVTGPYLWCGAADVYAETGEPELLKALMRIWSDVVEKKMYVTGAVGAYHHGVSVRFDLVHEAFGREYELPLRTAYNETCANISHAMWSRRLMQIRGDAQHADVMERVLYNPCLSAMSLDGRTFCYCNPLRRQQGTPLLNHDTPGRLETLKCYCCPPSVARTLAKSAWWAYGVSDNTIWINLYGSGQLNTALPGGRRVKISQQTDYPWDGTVTLRVVEAPSEPLTLKLRIPGWAESATIHVKGEPLGSPCVPGTYVPITRTWAVDDVVELELPMQPTLIQAHPLVETSWGQVAVMRGPLVYCAEALDLPDGVTLPNVRLPRHAKWTLRRDRKPLEGITVLETGALAAPAADASQGLYRRLPKGELRSFRLTMIPYYAWNNRGQTEMSVWLPVH